MISTSGPGTATQIPVADGTGVDRFAATIIKPVDPTGGQDPRLAPTNIVSPEQLAACDETGAYYPQVQEQVPATKPYSCKPMSPADLYDPARGMTYLSDLDYKQIDPDASIFSPAFDLTVPNEASKIFNNASLDETRELSTLFFQLKANGNFSHPADEARFNQLGSKIFASLLNLDQASTVTEQISNLLASVIVPRLQRKIALVSAVDPLSAAMRNFAVLAVPPSTSKDFDQTALLNFPYLHKDKDLEFLGPEFNAKVLAPALVTVLNSLYFSRSPLMLDLQNQVSGFRGQLDKFTQELRAKPDEHKSTIEFLRNFNAVLSAKAAGRDSSAAARKFCADHSGEFVENLGNRFDQFFDWSSELDDRSGVAGNRAKTYLSIGQQIIARNQDLVKRVISDEIRTRNEKVLAAGEASPRRFSPRSLAALLGTTALGIAVAVGSQHSPQVVTPDDTTPKPVVVLDGSIEPSPAVQASANDIKRPDFKIVSQERAKVVEAMPLEVKIVEYKGKAVLVSEIKSGDFTTNASLSEEARREAEAIKYAITNIGQDIYDTDKVIFLSDSQLRESVEKTKAQSDISGDETKAREVALGRACAQAKKQDGSPLRDFPWFRNCEYPWADTAWSAIVAKNPTGGQAIFVNTDVPHRLPSPTKVPGSLTAQASGVAQQ